MIQTLLKRSDLDHSTFTDSVSKIRVSTPESLIDTDFEYGLQSIKWETLHLVNNIPLYFSRSGDTPIPLTNVRTKPNTDYITVTTSSAHNLIDGAPIYISGLKSVTAEGYFLITKVTSTTEFVYKAKYTQTVDGTIFDTNTSYLFPGMMYQGTGLTGDQLISIKTNEAVPSTLEVVTAAPHGFPVGTGFTLTNTYGKRTVYFQTDGAISSNTITTTSPHGMYTGMQVTYNSGAGTTITGLTNNQTYLVIILTANTLQLSTNGTTPLTISGGTGQQMLTSVDNASDGSSYSISNIVNTTTFQMVAAGQILRNTIQFNFRTGLLQQSNASGVLPDAIFTFSVAHTAITGSEAIYQANGTALPGLTNGTTYYVIRVNEFAFKLATTRSEALAERANVVISIDVNTTGYEDVHTFILPSILGETRGVGTVSCANLSTIVSGVGVNFLSYFKAGDKIRINVPVASTITYTISSISGTVATLNTSISQQIPLRYTGTTFGTILVNNVIYYGRPVTGTQITIHPSYTDAVNNTNALNLTGLTTPQTLATVPTRTIIERTVAVVNNSTTLTLATANTAGAIGNVNYFIPSGLYPLSDAYVYHRAHDGGIELIPSNNANAQLIRQTRKYFRYQPGKGIQCSLSVNFNSCIEIDYLSRSGLTATARTRKPHRLSQGLSILISGTNDVNWEGTYTITSVTVNTFTYTLTSLPTSDVAGGFPIFKVLGWNNSALRAGLFDDQNGMFFEYDGVNMSAVRRDSITQLSGLVDVTFANNMVQKTNDTNTSFASQLSLGDMIVIRGMTYKVVNIESNDRIYIQPPYRGITENNVLISKVIDTKVPQSQWSIDKCNGTGPTGYVLDTSKIQMIYFDYSWYGAGKIRFGFKDTKGEVRYVHEFIHNNIMNQSYFRTGNLPARYEVNNTGSPSWVPPLLHWGTAVIMDGRYDDDKAYLFTASANILNFTNGDQIRVDGTIQSTTIRTTVYDPYTQRSVLAYNVQSTGTSSNVWYQLQNIKSGTPISGTYIQSLTYTVGTPQKENNNPSIALIYIDKVPTNTSPTTPITFTFGLSSDIIPNSIPLVSIRVAPSVDSSITGPLGVRELVNRMQLRLRSVDILTTNDTELRLVLNGFINNRNFVSASSPSLSQYIAHVKGDTIQDGSILFSYRVPGGINDSSGKKTTTVTSYDLSGLGYLGNSIQGGNGIYPDGPDVLTLVAVCLDPSGVSATTPYTVSARVTWAEAQA